MIPLILLLLLLLLAMYAPSSLWTGLLYIGQIILDSFTELPFWPVVAALLLAGLIYNAGHDALARSIRDETHKRADEAYRKTRRGLFG